MKEEPHYLVWQLSSVCSSKKVAKDSIKTALARDKSGRYKIEKCRHKHTVDT